MPQPVAAHGAASILKSATAAASRMQAPLLLLALLAIAAMLLMRLAGGGSSREAATPQSGPRGQTAPAGHTRLHASEDHPAAHDGQRLLLAAVDQLTQGPSIAARLHQRVKLLDGDVLGVGSYKQEASRDGGRFHLELRTKSGALQVVSDGNYIWHHIALGSARRITRIDLQYERLASAHNSAGRRGTPPRQVLGPMISPLKFGGIGNLLADLSERYRFGRIEQKVLSDVPIYEISGVLDEGKQLAGGAASPEGAVDPGPSASAPPPQVPSHVTVSLGRDDLFPYRVVFDLHAADASDHERGVPRRVEIQFSEVSLGGPIDNRSFEYSPPRDAAWEDITAETMARRQRPT